MRACQLQCSSTPPSRGLTKPPSIFTASPTRHFSSALALSSHATALTLAPPSERVAAHRNPMLPSCRVNSLATVTSITRPYTSAGSLAFNSVMAIGSAGLSGSFAYSPASLRFTTLMRVVSVDWSSAPFCPFFTLALRTSTTSLRSRMPPSTMSTSRFHKTSLAFVPSLTSTLHTRPRRSPCSVLRANHLGA